MKDRKFTYHRYDDHDGKRMVDVRDQETGNLVMRLEIPMGFETLRPQDMPEVEEQVRRALAKQVAQS